MHIEHSYGTHRIRCEVKDSPKLKVSSPFSGLHPDTASYAVKRRLVKDPEVSASIAKQSYRLRLEKGGRRKPKRCTVSGPADAFGLPGKKVRAAFRVTAEGAELERVELTA